jgi:hypothetical protein
MTQSELYDKQVAFIMGYLSKEAQEPQAPSAPSPNMNPAAWANQQHQQHLQDIKDRGGVGGAIHNWANNADPTKRAWGEGLGVAGLGALAGYTAGGDMTSALLGGGIAALIYYVAQTFFGGDMQKGRTLISDKINNDTIDTFHQQLLSRDPNNPTLQQIDVNQVKAFGEIGKVDAAIKNETDANALSDLYKRKGKAMENAGIPQILNTNIDKNQDNIPDFQQYGTPAFQEQAPPQPDAVDKMVSKYTQPVPFNQPQQPAPTAQEPGVGPLIDNLPKDKTPGPVLTTTETPGK